MGVIGHCFRHYADFSGRAKRSEFWYFMLFYIVAVAIISSIIVEIVWGRYGRGNYNLTVFVASIVGLPFIIPKLAVSVRRLHDRGISGALAISQFVISLLGVVLAFAGLGRVVAICRLVSLLLGVALLVVCALPGTQGPNQYGPDPCGHQASTGENGQDFQDIIE